MWHEKIMVNGRVGLPLVPVPMSPVIAPGGAITGLMGRVRPLVGRIKTALGYTLAVDRDLQEGAVETPSDPEGHAVRRGNRARWEHRRHQVHEGVMRWSADRVPTRHRHDQDAARQSVALMSFRRSDYIGTMRPARIRSLRYAASLFGS